MPGRKLKAKPILSGGEITVKRIWIPILFCLLAPLAMVSPAEAACTKDKAIEKAFRPNLEYHAKKAGVSQAKLNKRVAEIARDNQDCATLYAAYDKYLKSMKKKPKFPSLFKKW